MPRFTAAFFQGMRFFIKRISAVLLAILVIVLSGVISSGAENQDKTLYNDGKGIFLISYSSDKLSSTQLAPNINSFTYSFGSKVLSCCVLNNNLFVLVKNNKKQHSCCIYKAYGGNAGNPLNISNIDVNNSSYIAVDKSGYIYITDSSGKVRVYNKSGKPVKSYNPTINKLINNGEFILGFSGSKAYKITASEITLQNDDLSTTQNYKISDNYIGDYYGNVYNVRNGISKVFNNHTKGYYTTAESGKYLTVNYDNRLIAYNKNGGKVSEIKCNNTLALSSFNGKTAVIKKQGSDYSIEYISDSAFSNASGSSPKNTKGLNLGKYKHTKKYIYVNKGTTIADFKSRISYIDYEIDFLNRRSGNLRTGNKVSFTKSNNKISYTFIVRGDVTGTGNVNSRDEAMMFKHLLNQEKLKGIYKLAGDLNGDKKITNADLVKLSRLEN